MTIETILATYRETCTAAYKTRDAARNAADAAHEAAYKTAQDDYSIATESAHVQYMAAQSATESKP